MAGVEKLGVGQVGVGGREGRGMWNAQVVLWLWLGWNARGSRLRV